MTPRFNLRSTPRITSRFKRWLFAGVFLLATVTPFAAWAAEEGADAPEPHYYATFAGLVGPLVAICLALITKEVYSSLFVGIVVGALLWSNFDFEGTVLHVTEDGILSVLSDSWNVGILVFDVALGAIIVMMSRSGGAVAFGRWAQAHVHSRAGAQFCTMLLGVFIFVDDYFNCLTVGSVMRPLTDQRGISRAKLAYLVDATAAPICIIAPISTWAAAVSGFVEGENGFRVFIQSIPFNFYALLTLAFMLLLVGLNLDYGPMRRHEFNARHGDLFTTGERPFAGDEADDNQGKGRVQDMLWPVVFLIAACIFGMVYTGGIFQGAGLVDAFADADASLGLMLGSVAAVIFTVAYYLARRLLPFGKLMGCLPDGLKVMGPAIIILTFAWTLNKMTGDLGAGQFVYNYLSENAASLSGFLPAVIFLVACGLAFATGTSWGTFGILIPIVTAVFPYSAEPALLYVGMSACLAGAVFGDHVSPISDTTIMASAGAQSNHINHVNTQLLYALPVAAVSFIGFLIAGLTVHAGAAFWMGWVVSFLPALALVAGFLLLVKAFQKPLPEEPAAFATPGIAPGPWPAAPGVTPVQMTAQPGPGLTVNGAPVASEPAAPGTSQPGTWHG
ncbi:MAG: Na+/H+ antiporter NhaC family protein [Bifidobacteriaceae bacterium]|jgi:Na+/H+ antiporter NhaC|nr:Na+/H+ antiporter NhaC family protein [Bifidobacteriaceae bacterium]